MRLYKLDTSAVRRRDPSLLSPSEFDADAITIRSDQESDSDDDERQLRARNSQELRAHDRLVLVEEEETDQLVTESRQRQQQEQRGSGLTVPNPFRKWSHRNSDSSLRLGVDWPQKTQATSASGKAEKMRSRHSRRPKRREHAAHGEADDLMMMHEMEDGQVKDSGSTLGDSSSDEGNEGYDLLNKAGVRLGPGKHSRKRHRCWRWLLIHLVIAMTLMIIGLTLLTLLTKRQDNNADAPSTPYLSNGTSLFAPTTIIFSLDGFRADFLQRGITPRLDAMIEEGVSPLYMRPSFPSVTFPNHFTLATGLYPESHGVVGNKFWDPALREEFHYTDPARSMQPKWWLAEPFWVTAELQGVRTAIHMWPGSEAHIGPVEPTFLDKYDGKEKLSRKVDRILELLDKPGPFDTADDDGSDAAVEQRPQIIAAYVPNVDADGHKYGPNSTEILATIQATDAMLDQVFRGLEERNLTHIVNVMVVSDHGMASTDVTRLIQLEDLVDVSKVGHNDGWPLVGLRPKNMDDLPALYDQVLAAQARTKAPIEVYLKDVNMPERYHFSKSDRIAPLWIVPKTGWAIVTKEEMDVRQAQATGAVYHPKGLHGYDHEHPLMRAIFIARGPAFPHPPNSKLKPFQNIEVYNILCDSVGIRSSPNNGTLHLPLHPIGLHSDPGDDRERPSDPPFLTSVLGEEEGDNSTQTTPSESASSSSSQPDDTDTDTDADEVTDDEDVDDDNDNDKGNNNEEEEGEEEESLRDKAEEVAKQAWEWLGRVWEEISGIFG